MRAKSPPPKVGLVFIVQSFSAGGNAHSGWSELSLLIGRGGCPGRDAGQPFLEAIAACADSWPGFALAAILTDSKIH